MVDFQKLWKRIQRTLRTDDDYLWGKIGLILGFTNIVLGIISAMLGDKIRAIVNFGLGLVLFVLSYYRLIEAIKEEERIEKLIGKVL